MRFHEGEAGGKERLQYDDDEDDEGHADNDDDLNSLMKIAPIVKRRGGLSCSDNCRLAMVKNRLIKYGESPSLQKDASRNELIREVGESILITGRLI